MEEHGTWISVREFFRKYDEPEKFYIDFRPDKRKINLPSYLTGFAQEHYTRMTEEEIKELKEEGNYTKPYKCELESVDQELETEEDLGGWHIFKISQDESILMSHNATKSKLGLGGETGYENAKEILEDYGKKCYSSQQLSLEGSSIEARIIRELSQWLTSNDEEGKSYWTFNIYSDEEDEEDESPEPFEKRYTYQYYVGCVDRRYHNDRLETYYNSFDDAIILHRKTTECYIKANEYIAFGFRPIIFLNNNIAIKVEDDYYDGSTPERALRIRCSDIEQQREIIQSQIDSIMEQIKELKKLVDGMYL